MKRFYTSLTLVLFALALQATIPAAWQTKYATCNGRKGAALKTALYKIIASHTQKSYSSLWDCYTTTDVHTDGTIWDMYSTVTDGTLYPTDHSGNYTAEGDLLNREHSVPSSWFGKAYPMYSDLFHVIPVDGYINGMRSNLPYGETSSPTKTSSGGFSKYGPCDSSIGYSGTIFEPNDEYKGDLARNYFYMATCYEDNVATWTSDMFGGTTYPAFTSWAQTMLVRWATNDVVSAKEIARNEAVYAIQGNRNPFIDYPGLEEYVWGSKTDVLVNLLADGTIEETTVAADDDDSDSDLYEEVTAATQLVAGKNYIVVYETGSLAMKYDGSNFKGLSYAGHITTGGAIDISELSDICVLTLGGETGAWTFAFTYNNETKYLNFSTKNTLTVLTTATANAQKWTIDPTATNPIISNNVLSSTTYYLQYNTSDYFRCYSGTQKSVKLYVQSESSSSSTTPPVAPTFSSEDESELTQGTTVTISTSTTGATIQYSTDGGTTWTTGNSLTLNNLGSVTIQARAVLGEQVSSITEVNYTIVASTLSGIFRKITSTDDLETGVRYLIVSETYNAALGGKSGNFRTKATVTPSEEEINLSETTGVYPLTLNGTSSGYTLSLANDSLLAMSGSNNTTLTTLLLSNISNNARWTITFSDDGNAVIQSLTSTTTQRAIRYNNSYSRFGYYSATGDQPVQLYKETNEAIAPNAPVISPSSDTYYVGASVSVSITAATGATIYYTTDGSTPTTSSATYSSPLTVNATTTIKAIAVKNDLSSTVSEATYTFNTTQNYTNQYERIYTDADLISGQEYLLVIHGNVNIGTQSSPIYRAASDALGSWTSGSSRYAAVNVTVSGDEILERTTGDNAPTLLTITYRNNYYTISYTSNDNTYYIGYNGSGTNLSQATSYSDTKYHWNISVTDGVALIQNVSETTRYLGYYYNESGSYFRAYLQSAVETGSTTVHMQLFAKRSTTTSISRFRYGTYFDQRAYVVPEGLTAMTLVADEDRRIAAGTTYTEGNTVPASTPVLLYGGDGTNSVAYTLVYRYNPDDKPDANTDDNLLRGSMATVAADDLATASGVSASEYRFYKLTTYQGANMGFYYGADDGAPFAITAEQKSWLILPRSGAEVRSFVLDFDTLTAIGDITTGTSFADRFPADTLIYDLQGRRVFNPKKGSLYIVGGKKVYVK